MPTNERAGIDWRAVYRRLRIARLTLGLTEAEAAAAASISLRTYKKWEANHDRPARTGPMLAFAEAYDVSLDWLILGEGGWLGKHLTIGTASKVAILPTRAQA
jgi:transcriptional regulator with XRE-family HTH domain